MQKSKSFLNVLFVHVVDKWSSSKRYHCSVDIGVETKVHCPIKIVIILDQVLVVQVPGRPGRFSRIPNINLLGSSANSFVDFW